VRITSVIEQELGCRPLVLVVSDDHEIRDGTEQLLISDGYRIETARDEQTAAERASSCCPNLILVSLAGRPDAVVAAAVRMRRRAELDASVPVVVFSVPTIDEGAEIALGRNVHVIRPDNFDQLRSLVGRVILESLRVI